MRLSPTLPTLTLVTCFSLASSASAWANDPPPSIRRGAFSTWPVAVLLDGSEATVNHGVHLKRSGDQDNPLTVPGALGAPIPGDADFAAALRLPDGNGGTFNIGVDAMSTGNGFFPPVDANGEIHVGNRWLAITGSIQNGDEGATGSQFERAHNATSNAGAELATYYLPGSTVPFLPPALIGTSTLEMGRAHLGLSTAAQTEVSGLDYGMAMIHEHTQSVGLFANDNVVFFSVTPEFAVSPEGQNFYASSLELTYYTDPTLAELTAQRDSPAHEGDIYLRQWDFLTGAWTPPMRFLGYEDLGMNVDGNVDALEVNAGGSMVLYSASIGALQSDLVDGGVVSQIMYTQRWGPGPNNARVPIAVKDSNGDTVASKLGVRDDGDGDELDGICGVDPEAATYVPSTKVAIPTAEITPLGSAMGISAVRGVDPATGADGLYLQVSGWGGVVPATGTIRVWRTSGVVRNYLDWRTSTWLGAHVGTRLAQDETYEWFVPNLMPLTNTNHVPKEYSFFAAVLNPNGTIRAGSFVCSMKL